MKEPEWDEVVEYCYQRADTLASDAQVVAEYDALKGKRILELADAYRELVGKIDRLINASVSLPK